MQRCGVLAYTIFLVPPGRKSFPGNISPCCLGCFTKQCRCEGDVCPALKQSSEFMQQAMTSLDRNRISEVGACTLAGTQAAAVGHRTAAVAGAEQAHRHRVA